MGVPQVLDIGGNDQTLYSTNNTLLGAPQQLVDCNSSRPLPDFDSLLTDLSQTLEASLYQDYDLATLKGMELDRVQALPQDEMTFYEDLPPAMVPIKTEKVDFNYQEHHQGAPPQYPTQNGSQLLSEATQLGTLTPADSSDMDEVTSEIQGVCRHLDIPIDPYSWSVDQVQKWASWMLNKYQLPMHYVDAFRIDGTSLCMLSDLDLKARFPQFGDYLFAELEILKGAYTVSSSSPSPTHSIQEDVQNATYMDLDACSHANTTQQCSLQPAFITMPVISDESTVPLNIPKPVFTTMAPSLSPAPSIDSMDSASGYGSSPSSLSLESDFADVTSAVAGPSNEIKATVSPSKQNIHLWQFLRELLLQPQSYSNCIRWLDRSKGIFKIEDSARVARLWGQRKNRPAMNYDKLSRSIRQYYKKGIIRKTDNSKRLVYQFCPQYRA